ncbi:hypothetical protein TeGR_g14526 [Tetraparma gracilis]|uniref:Class I SAM-dependent methyltransferase n=1 Tax=Tetraparma gracilis TaxID=2962635 RepID=A0ABQ6N4Z4_9STRA|nr:hypothetical protein TeGR_g14526 [Tetraparma gracilis]
MALPVPPHRSPLPRVFALSLLFIGLCLFLLRPLPAPRTVAHPSFDPRPWVPRSSPDYGLCHITLKDRAGIPQYLNQLGLTNEGVEIGVRRGHYSNHMLKFWEGTTLHLVDPWEHQVAEAKQGGLVYNDVSNAMQGEHDENLAHVIETLDSFAKGRYEVHRAYSVDAAKDFTDGQLDFVYIDARHDYAGVLEDLEAWYPKLRSGGLIAGHDFIPDQIKPVEGDFGVQGAVFKFAQQVKREVQSISTKDKAGGREEPQRVDGGWTTFYWIK